jgi:hypothetical protein
MAECVRIGQVIDDNHFNARMVHQQPENPSPNPSETVDGYSNHICSKMTNRLFNVFLGFV